MGAGVASGALGVVGIVVALVVLALVLVLGARAAQAPTALPSCGACAGAHANHPVDPGPVGEAAPPVMYVTAFADIGRGDWSVNARPRALYLQYYLNLLEQGVPLVTFVHPDVAHDIRSMAGPVEHVYDYADPAQPDYTQTHAGRAREILGSPRFRAVTADWHPPLVEHEHPMYTLVTHNKVLFLQRARALFPSTRVFVWVDFGYVRSRDTRVAMDPQALLGATQVVLGSQVPVEPEAIPDPVTMVRENSSPLRSGMIIVPAALVDELARAYRSQVDALHAQWLVGDDQDVFLQLIRKQPWLFRVLPTPWFGLQLEFRQ